MTATSRNSSFNRRRKPPALPAMDHTSLAPHRSSVSTIQIGTTRANLRSTSQFTLSLESGDTRSDLSSLFSATIPISFLRVPSLRIIFCLRSTQPLSRSSITSDLTFRTDLSLFCAFSLHCRTYHHVSEPSCYIFPDADQNSSQLHGSVYSSSALFVFPSLYLIDCTIALSRGQSFCFHCTEVHLLILFCVFIAYDSNTSSHLSTSFSLIAPG